MLEGIVYKSIDYKETSKIVYLYTRGGKVSVKVSGLNKKNNNLKSFPITGNIVKYNYSDTIVPTLIDYDMILSPLNHSDNLEYLEALRVVILVLNQLPEDINDYRTYNFVKNILTNIAENPKKILSTFLIKMLYSFGVTPNLKECANCKKKDNLVFFDVDAGVSLCSSCGPNVGNYEDWYKFYFAKVSYLNVEDSNYEELFNEIMRYYENFFHLSLKIKFI